MLYNLKVYTILFNSSNTLGYYDLESFTFGWPKLQNRKKLPKTLPIVNPKLQMGSFIGKGCQEATLMATNWQLFTVL